MPRTYREVARRRSLKLNKRHRKSVKKIRKELRYQFSYINRNLSHIEAYTYSHMGFEGLHPIKKERLLAIYTFYEQQSEILVTKGILWQAAS